MIQQITIQTTTIPQSTQPAQDSNTPRFDSVLRKAMQVDAKSETPEQKGAEPALTDAGLLSLLPVPFLMNPVNTDMLPSMGQVQVPLMEGAIPSMEATMILSAPAMEESVNLLGQVGKTETNGQASVASLAGAQQSIRELLQGQTKDMSHLSAITTLPTEEKIAAIPVILQNASVPTSAVQAQGEVQAAPVEQTVVQQHSALFEQPLPANTPNSYQTVQTQQGMPSGKGEQAPPTSVDSMPIVNESPIGVSPLWQSPESVSSAAPTNQTSYASAATFTQLTEQILKNHAAGNNTFQMDLFPKNLGKVSVSIGMEQGVMVVDILADSAKTQSLLLSNSADIRSLLENAVGQPVQIAQAPQQPMDYDDQRETEQQESQQQQQQQQPEEQEAQEFLTVLQQLKLKNSIL